MHMVAPTIFLTTFRACLHTAHVSMELAGLPQLTAMISDFGALVYKEFPELYPPVYSVVVIEDNHKHTCLQWRSSDGLLATVFFEPQCPGTYYFELRERISKTGSLTCRYPRVMNVAGNHISDRLRASLVCILDSQQKRPGYYDPQR